MDFIQAKNSRLCASSTFIYQILLNIEINELSFVDDGDLKCLLLQNKTNYSDIAQLW